MDASLDRPYRHGAQEAVRVLRGEWTVAVLATLGGGEMQYKEILPAINGVEERVGWTSHRRPLSDRVLSDTLARMQGDRLIERKAEPGTFGAAWYSLTAKGRALLATLRPLAEWAREFAEPPSVPAPSRPQDS